MIAVLIVSTVVFDQAGVCMLDPRPVILFCVLSVAGWGRSHRVQIGSGFKSTRGFDRPGVLIGQSDQWFGGVDINGARK